MKDARPDSVWRRVAEVAGLFLRLGCTAFGGPAAHIGLLEEEVVRRRQWLTECEFLDVLGAMNLIPGPNSTEMVIEIGRRRAGTLGLITAGVCFIAPAMLMVWALAWGYERYGQMPLSQGLFYGLKPVVIAIIVAALWRLGRSALHARSLVVWAVVAALVNAALGHELAVLFGSGMAMAAIRHWQQPRAGEGDSHLGGFGLGLSAGWMSTASAGTLSTATAVATPLSLPWLLLSLMKVGTVLYGGGYVLLAFLRADLVERWGWLSEAELLDAVAVGQFTPGPLLCTATFIGYKLFGPAGAVLSTAAIFLPAFVFVAICGPWIVRLRQSAVAGAFLDGVNAAALALMAVVTCRLARAAVVDVPTAVVVALGVLALMRFRVHYIWLLLVGGVVGVLRVWLVG